MPKNDDALDIAKASKVRPTSPPALPTEGVGGAGTAAQPFYSGKRVGKGTAADPYRYQDPNESKGLISRAMNYFHEDDGK